MNLSDPGEHMKGNQFMDGTPHVTQCPILPSAKFTYKFEAQENAFLALDTVCTLNLLVFNM